MNELIYKSAPINLQGGDNDGYLIGYANIYNEKDLQGDISAPTSFIKTVSERKAKIKIYRNHDSNQFVGVPIDMKADDPVGLHITAKMLLDTQLGRDTYAESKFLVENGFESGFSIGGWVLQRDKMNKSIVTEYKLSEISVLTKEQANAKSMVSMIKSFQQEEQLKVEEFWNAIIKAYNTNFSDNILKSLETFLTLAEKPEIIKSTTLIDEPTNLIKQVYSQFIFNQNGKNIRRNSERSDG